MATIAIGKIKQVWRDTWANNQNYAVDDLVAHTDQNITSTYIAVQASTSGSPQAPSTSGTVNTSYWNLVAKGVADPIPNQNNNAGKFLKTDGSSLSFDDAGGGFQSKQTFFTSGTHTYTKPAGISKIKVYITGAGASGSGGDNESDYKG